MPKHEEFEKKLKKWLDFFNEKNWTVKCRFARSAGVGERSAILADYDFDKRGVSFVVPEDENLTEALMDRIAFGQACAMMFYSIAVDSEDIEDDAQNAMNLTRDFAIRMDECVYPVLRTVMQSVGRA